VNLRPLPSCLFPREQGVTGKNPTALPASLTGRIWFFVTDYEPLLINVTPTEYEAALPPLCAEPRFVEAVRTTSGTSPSKAAPQDRAKSGSFLEPPSGNRPRMEVHDKRPIA
jgi:hypothetical protein